jgi:aspartate-semialdehyde dehydrogenase
MSKSLAIVGATGAVGSEILKLLGLRSFPVQKIRCFASKASVGRKLFFKETEITVEPLSSFEGIGIIFFAAGKKVSLEFVPKALEAGCFVIDSSSAFRMNAPLIIPEINLGAMGDARVVASPNCTASIMLMALAPLHKISPIKRIVAATYQAASGAGLRAMEELQNETRAALQNEPFTRTIMPHPYAFNLFPHNAPMTESMYNEEEVKVIEETRKILNEPQLRIAVTSVRVPVLRAHSMALNVEFENNLSPEEAKAILSCAPGVRVVENWAENRFAMPSDAEGQNDVFVGRIRRDLSQEKTLDLWAVGDQLLKGAALNAIQIAEAFQARSVSRPRDAQIPS